MAVPVQLDCIPLFSVTVGPRTFKTRFSLFKYQSNFDKRDFQEESIVQVQRNDFGTKVNDLMLFRFDRKVEIKGGRDNDGRGKNKNSRELRKSASVV
jgi:hypothetical protein